MKTTKSNTAPKTKTTALTSKKSTKKTVATAEGTVCTCENCMANTQATRLNHDFLNAVFIVSLGVNLILFTLIITAMVSETYAQQLSVFF